MAYDERGDRFTEGVHGLAGYQVYDRHYEKIGKVDDIFVDENDRPEYIAVKTGFFGTRSTLIPVGIVRVNDKRQLVEVAANKDVVEEGPTFGDDREITAEFERRVLAYYRIETAEASSERGTRTGERHPGAATGRVDHERGGEEPRAEVGEREAGRVNVRKRVRTDPERLEVPKKREEVHAERVPVEGREASEAEIGDDEVRIPIIEEEIVVEKRPVVKEEIRLRKEVVEEEEVVEEDVRREEVDIDDRTERRPR